MVIENIEKIENVHHKTFIICSATKTLRKRLQKCIIYHKTSVLIV